MNRLYVLLPIRTVSEANRRDHWATKARRVKLHRRTAYAMTERVSLPCVVTMTRVGPRMLDDDNLRGALKATRDGIADRLGVDDADPRVEWRYAQQRGREYGVIVDIAAGRATSCD